MKGQKKRMSYTGRPIWDIMSCLGRPRQDALTQMGRPVQDILCPILLLPLRIDDIDEVISKESTCPSG